MGLIGNNFRLNTGVHRSLGDAMALTIGNIKRYSSFCNTRSADKATTVLSKTAIPCGGYPSATYYPPQESGQMSFRPLGESSLSGSLISDRTMDLDLTGSGNLSADLASVISMLLNMVGNGGLSASIVGLLNMEIDITGSGDLMAGIKGVANMAVDMIGDGGISAEIYGDGNMSIDMVVTGTGLSTANVGQYVWQAILSQFSADPNSAAAKLLAAGSAGDPWSTDLPASYTGDQAGYILSQIQTLVDELHKIRGLDAANPWTVTPTGEEAGSIILDASGDGVTSSTLTRQ